MSRRGIALAAAAGLVLAVAAAPTTSAAPAPPATGTPPPTSAASIPDSQRDQVLPKGWRSANDRAVTTDGDSTGLHVLVADAKDGYTWRTAATLTEPGTETDQWIADSCVTGSGNRAVVVYAPRQMVNSDDGFQRGGLVAIVDLNSGAVTKLPVRASLAYYNPGCGIDENAVVTENLYQGDKYVSRLMTVDAATGKVTRSVDADGQVTSSVPVNGDVLAAKGSLVVSVDGNGGEHQLLETHGTPFRLGVDAQGGVGYEVRTAKNTQLHRIVGGKDSLLTTVKLDSVQLHQVAGKLFVQGQDAKQAVAKTALPAGWQAVNIAADAELSTSGGLAVTSSDNMVQSTGKAPSPGMAAPISIKSTVLATGAHPAFTVTPQALRPAAGNAPSPGIGGTTRQPAVAPKDDDPSTDTTDPDRKCAVPRNDPRIQSLQPTPQMAEWAADLAVQGQLNVTRGAGWNGTTLPAYTPQGLFPPHALTGGGQVPAQILLGVMAQESNMWQAGPDTVDGESGNFEQGGFYGSQGTIDFVDFPHADCGYGVTQVTTGMSVGEQVYNSTQQVALTVDYAANIAAGLEILQDKWNQMKQLGVVANNADPSKLENWWFALWAYNSGWHDQGDPSGAGAWGLGWTNNMANEDLMPDRAGFLDDSYDDAKTPNKWTYPERVMGWANHSLVRINWVTGFYGPTFETATWAGFPVQRPDFGQFCQSVNDCDMTQIHFPADYPGDSGSHCLRDDLRCWWHQPATWTDCASRCGSEQVRYPASTPEPDPGAGLYRPTCTAQADLPAGSLIIDDVPSGIRTNTGCAVQPTNDGTLTWKFNRGDGGFPAKIDFHQLDGGMNGHMWTAHAWSNASTNVYHGVTGTWTLDRQINGWARVLVYIPDHAAMTPQANYTVNGSDSTSPTREVVEGTYLDDSRHVAPGRWASLGSFHFTGTPSVSLSNLMQNQVDGDFADGERDIAWDAIAFQPLPGQPKDDVVGLGDSYASGEGASDSPVNGVWSYYPDSDHDGSTKDGDDPAWRDACHRSPYSWSRQATLNDRPSENIGTRADDFDPTLDYHSSACSGAWTNNMLKGGQGQFDEGAQLDQGYLDQYTSLVTLSIGGNDARFIDVLFQCVTYLGGLCQNSVLDKDPAPLAQAEPDRVNNTVEPAIESVITQINKAAPHAKILLMGYPDFFDNGGQCLAGIGVDEEPWLNQMADLMDDAIDRAATNKHNANIDVTFSDPRKKFENKAICGDEQQINPLVTSLTRGDDPTGFFGLSVSGQSFHPTIGGAANYADVANATLRLMKE